MSQTQHVFTGVFIPAKIWLDKSITPIAKMLLAEIRALSERNGWCNASNGHFADWMGCGISNVKYHLNKLQEIGAIETVFSGENGQGRRIRVVSEWYFGTKEDALPPFSGTEAPFSGTEAPFSGTEAEIQYKLKLNKEVKEENAPEEEKSASPLEDAEQERNTTPARPGDFPATIQPGASGAMVNHHGFDIEAAATRMRADYRCQERFARDSGISIDESKEPFDIAVKEFVADQIANTFNYSMEAHFRKHFFAWVPLRRAAYKRQAIIERELKERQVRKHPVSPAKGYSPTGGAVYEINPLERKYQQ